MKQTYFSNAVLVTLYMSSALEFIYCW